jgi:hypothetical protein
MNWFSGVPWWGQVVLLIVFALIAVFLFQNIVLPLIHTIAK